jgi:hypothetical protein
MPPFLLFRGDGTTPITGLSNTVVLDEPPVDLFGNPLITDAFGDDLESILRAPDGSFWLVDEYRPAIYHFDGDPDGDGRSSLLARYVPEGTAALAGEAVGTFGMETLPTEYASRDAVYDVRTGRIFVIERDSGTAVTSKKFIFEIDFTGATNLLAAGAPAPLAGKTLEQHTADELAQAGIRPVHKRKELNLPSVGYTAGDKPEGLALLDDGQLAVLNDNDFGLAAGDIPLDGRGSSPQIPLCRRSV